jgi:protease IV
MWNWSKPNAIDPNDPNRDWRLVESILQESFSEQKKSRRWGIVFKSLTFLYLFILLILMGASSAFKGGLLGANEPHVAVVKLDGVISAQEIASAGKINSALREAFKNEHAKAVVLTINSPGGSPVQSGYIYDEIKRLRSKYPEKKLYAVIADLGASGGYYVASAADEIYADKASLVGSIGVTASSFGFVGTMEKLGVERRHFTAGEHKAFLDPFSPVKEEEKQFWQEVLANTHQQFITAVKNGRGEKLQITDEITSGLIWNGEQALKLGLIDGLGDVRFVAREKIGQEELRDYTVSPSPFKKLLEDLGVSIGRGLGQSIYAEGIPQLQ